MTGVKMGDRFAQVGCPDGGRLAAVALKVGLSGRAVAIVPDAAWRSTLLFAMVNCVIALSLNHHQGQALAGTYDPVGIAAGLVLAVGGLLVGAWGWTRRDIGR